MTNDHNPPNPYESPHAGRTARDDWPSVPMLWMVVATLAAGFVLTFYFPLVGVPATLVCVPALVLAARNLWRRRRQGMKTDWEERVGIGLLSMAAAIPVSIAGGITFCCVCSGLSAAGLTITEGSVGSGTPWYHSMTILYTAMYGGLGAGLGLALLLLKHLHYMAWDEEKNVAQRSQQVDSDSIRSD